jgi:MFS family permease
MRDQYTATSVKQRSPLLPIFLIVLVDVLGFTIVIPLLAYYAERFGASPLVATTLVSVYAVCSLISTPIIGNLSDKVGRRRMLLISQCGTLAGFLMLAWSSSLWMVFLGRILDGITAGNLSLAQAYISDHTKPENRAKSFAVIGIAFGVGFMFGPGLGGVLAKYGLYVPFLVSACLSALSIFSTYTLLPRHEKPPQAAEGEAGPGGRRPGAFDLKTYTEYFGRKGVGALYLQFFLFVFAFTTFTSGFALFSERRFTVNHTLPRVTETCTAPLGTKLDDVHVGERYSTMFIDGKPLPKDAWTMPDVEHVKLAPAACARARAPSAVLRAELPWGVREVGFLFVYTGFLGILIQGGLIGRLVKKMGEVKLGLVAFGACVAGFVILGFAETLAVLLGAATISAFGTGVVRPVLTSRITQAVGRHEQGVALGISGSLSSFAMMVAPPVGGALLDHSATLAWALVAASAAALGLLVSIAKRNASPAVAPASPAVPEARVVETAPE